MPNLKQGSNIEPTDAVVVSFVFVISRPRGARKGRIIRTAGYDLGTSVLPPLGPL